MAGTVDDFIQRFGGAKTMDEKDAGRFFDRFASNDPNDRDFDNDTMYEGATEYLGKLPQQDFENATQNAYANASPTQQQGLASSLMRALQGRGVDAGSLGGLFGQGGGGNLSQLNPSQYARLAGFARQNHPDAMREVVREQPWMLKAMGNPIVMGALGMVASRMMKSRMQDRPLKHQQQQGQSLLGSLFR